MAHLRPTIAMINRILVCLDKSTYTDSAIDYACGLAKQHDASLEGLVVLDAEGISRSVGAVPLGAMMDSSCLKRLKLTGSEESKVEVNWERSPPPLSIVPSRVR